MNGNSAYFTEQEDESKTRLLVSWMRYAMGVPASLVMGE